MLEGGFAVHSVAAEPPAERALAMAASASENRGASGVCSLTECKHSNSPMFC